jgi:hypothetical protein
MPKNSLQAKPVSRKAGSKSCKKEFPVCDVMGEDRSSEQTSNWRQTPPALTNALKKQR